ncbi:MAG: rhomboid family intramembrane serine protease [Sulfolobales archaeon]
MDVMKIHDTYILMTLFVITYIALIFYGISLLPTLNIYITPYNIVNILIRPDAPIVNGLNILFITHHTAGLHIMLQGEEVFKGSVWELVTSLFIHANIYHLFFNSLALLIIKSISSTLEVNRNIIKVFLVGGILSNLSVAIILPNTYSLGASGGIFAVFAWVALINYLERRDNVPLIVLLTMLFLSSIPIIGVPNVVAHVVGALVGSLIAIYKRH